MATSNIDSLRKAGIACIAGALITAIGATVSQITQASTVVSDEMWSYPWSSGTFVAVTLLWGLSNVLIFIGLLGLRRSGLAGPTRAAGAGLALALTGTALLLVGQLASLPLSDQKVDDTGPAIVGGVFGLGTILSAIGLIMAGKATMQAGLWRDWRRFAPLVTGIWTLVLVGLVFTKIMAAGIAIYGLCLLALGVALYTRPSPATTAPASAQVQGA
ncbi:MAG: hypothetical protein M3370_12225 [Actinomycetota bacterium]|nr:hypothetical protein [Actinomycetota bacterium]